MRSERMKTAILAILIFAMPVLAKSQEGKWVTGFWPGPQAIHYSADAVDMESLTHLIISSAVPNSDGSLEWKSRKVAEVDVKKLVVRAHHANKKILLSIGGANSRDSFAAATQSKQLPVFISNLSDLISKWSFDGLDIDWEPILPGDYNLILALGQALRAKSPKMIMTIDVPKQNSNNPISGDTAKFYLAVGRLFDQVNIMTYRGSFLPRKGLVVGHSSPLTGETTSSPYSVQNSVEQYLTAGIPPAKLGVGIGFFGSCWDAPVTAPGQPIPNQMLCSQIHYTDLVNSYLPSMSYHYDKIARVPFLSSEAPIGKCQCTFISYENESSIKEKLEYAKRVGLGGVMIWNLSIAHNPMLSEPDSLLHFIVSFWKK